jgi:hypothetical protein
VIPLNIGIDEYTENIDDDGNRVITDKSGQTYRVIFNVDSGKISTELLNPVEIKGQEQVVIPNNKNIKFTIISDIDEMLIPLLGEDADILSDFK